MTGTDRRHLLGLRASSKALSPSRSSESHPPTMDLGGKRRDDYASEIAANISCHGLQDWAKADTICRKIFWTIIMIGAFSGIIYYNYQIGVLFFNNPTATSIQEEKQDYMLFPNVTICNTGKYNETYINQTMLWPPRDQILVNWPDEEIMSQFVRYLMILAYNKEDFKDPAANKTMQNLYHWNFNHSINPNAHNIKTYVEDAAYDCNNFLKSCRFSYKAFNCCDHSTRVFSDFGTCYHLKVAPRYGGQADAVQDFPGFGSAFEFKTELAYADMPSATSKTKNFGVRLHIGPYMTVADHSPVLVPSEMHAFIRLDATKRQYKDTCITDVDKNKKMIYSSMYTPGICTWEKIFTASNDDCNCSPLGYYLDDEELGTKRLCNIEEIRTCVIPIRSGIGQRGPLEDIDRMCMRECNTLTYDPVVSYFKIRSKVERTDVILNRYSIYFGQLSYTVVLEETLMTMDTFISNIGGVCGLWTGMTLITIIQCLSLFICKPCNEMWKKRRDGIMEKMGKKKGVQIKFKHAIPKAHPLVPAPPPLPTQIPQRHDAPEGIPAAPEMAKPDSSLQESKK